MGLPYPTEAASDKLEGYLLGCYEEGMGEQHAYDRFIINYEAMNNCRFACHISHPGFESRCS